MTAASELCPVFGVRHFSPAAAIHVRRFLDDHDPAVVLIEGPSDATEQLIHLVHKKTVPPVAILAFTKVRPVRSILFPLAGYSAEWVAARWALEKKRDVKFIDLEASVFLATRAEAEKRAEALRQKQEDEAAARVAGDQGEEAEGGTGATGDAGQGPDDTQRYLDDPYEEIAKIAGEIDHATWWERQFEHTVEVSAYRDAIFEFGKGLRDVRREAPERVEETLVREAHMRRAIRAALKGGERKAVVVCGAYHAPVLTSDLDPMTDEAYKALPRADCVITLMPYSYPRLSSQSGYGAGNHAPAYFQLLFEQTLQGTAHRARTLYLTRLARELRKAGIVRSSAEVIEAQRLAEGLAAMNQSPAPTLQDLRDSAITLLGHGERRPLELAISAVEIGSAVGQLPPGVSRTALQDDFHALVKALKLEKFIEDKENVLELDLREDRTKKTKDAALRDRHISTFLQRLAVLEVGFGTMMARDQRGTSREKWKLRWKPDCEIRLAECSLLADSIESGAAFTLAERLRESTDVATATRVLLHAANCELGDALTLATRKVADLTVEEAGFPNAAEGIHNLMELVRYGNVRDVDTAPFRPILEQLYLRSTLLFFGACVCDDDAAKLVRKGIDRVQDLAFLGEDNIDPKLWIEAVRSVSTSDNRNPFLSGYATALLVERGEIGDEDIDREVSRRLSPGCEASVGVGWFEGLVQRNRAALFLRMQLWSSLADYVDALDDEAFRRALLYLRRAFSTFSQSEVRRVVGLLAEIWKGDAGAELAAEVEKKIDPSDLQQLTDDLGDLDML